MRLRKRGFTLVEMMIALLIMGIMLTMALPKVKSMNDHNQMRSAKDGIASRIAAARASAIATGRTSTFYLAADTMRFTTGTGAAEANKGTTVNLYRQFGVHVTSSALSIPFDGRGMTTGSAQKIIFSRSVFVDSICISPIGLINRHGCAQ